MIVPWSCGLEMSEIDWLWLHCKDELNTGVMGNKKLPPCTDRFPHPPPPTISSHPISDTFYPLNYSPPPKPNPPTYFLSTSSNRISLIPFSTFPPFSSSPNFSTSTVVWPPITAFSNLLPRFSGPTAAVTAIPNAMMAVATPMTGPYEGTSLPWPPAGRMRWDSAMALTICAEGLEIMFPSWYCGGWGFISLVFYFFVSFFFL